MLHPISVHLGYYHKISLTEYLINNINVFLIGQETEKSKIRAVDDLVSYETNFLVHKFHFLAMSSRSGRDKTTLLGIFFEGINPFIHLHLLVPSLW